MRKAFLEILAVVIVFSVGATSAFAAGSKAERNFVDVDGDGVCDLANGICDNFGVEYGRNYADADGDGICDHATTGQGYGQEDSIREGCSRNYVDANGDGICDNYSAGQGRGSRNGFRGGRSK